MGKTFTMLSHFWSIVNVIMHHYYCNDNGTPLQDRATLTIAENTYQQLMAWTDSIASYFSQGELSPHHVDIFQ